MHKCCTNAMLIIESNVLIINVLFYPDNRLMDMECPFSNKISCILTFLFYHHIFKIISTHFSQ